MVPTEAMWSLAVAAFSLGCVVGMGLHVISRWMRRIAIRAAMRRYK